MSQPAQRRKGNVDSVRECAPYVRHSILIAVVVPDQPVLQRGKEPRTSTLTFSNHCTEPAGSTYFLLLASFRPPTASARTGRRRRPRRRCQQLL